jgi:hypothetical protein
MGARESRPDSSEEVVDYYQLLEVSEDASADEIKVPISPNHELLGCLTISCSVLSEDWLLFIIRIKTKMTSKALRNGSLLYSKHTRCGDFGLQKICLLTARQVLSDDQVSEIRFNPA